MNKKSGEKIEVTKCKGLNLNTIRGESFNFKLMKEFVTAKAKDEEKCLKLEQFNISTKRVQFSMTNRTFDKKFSNNVGSLSKRVLVPHTKHLCTLPYGYSEEMRLKVLAEESE